MNKTVKVTLFGTFSVALLIVIAVVVFAATFDLNNYKDRIAQVVKAETGRTLSFDGDVHIVFFPTLAVELGGVSLSNAQGFGSKPMVEAKSARVSVRVLPLFKGEIKFGHLKLDGPTLNLSRNDGGVSNWDDLVGRGDASQTQQSAASKQFSLEIDGITLSDGSLYWDDRVSDTMFILRGMTVNTGRIYEGAPFPIDAALDFNCSKPNAKGRLEFSGKSSIDFLNREYGHIDMKLSVTAEGNDIPGGKGAAELTLQFAVLDFNKENAQITGLTVSSYGTTVHMDGTIEGITTGVKKLAATVTVDSFNAKQTLAALGMDVPDTEDPTSLTSVKGMAEIQYSPDNMHFKTLQADVDGTRIIGRGRYKLEAGDPFYFARLDVGELDLDKYMPPDLDSKTQQSRQAVAQGEKSDQVIDSALLRRLNLDIEANIASLRVKNVLMEKVKAVIKARQGIVRVNPLSSNFYGGTFSSGLTVDASGTIPEIDLIAGFDKVDLGDLSKDAAGEEELDGILNFNTALSCDGDSVPIMLRSMDGKLSFNVTNGVFPGVDLLDMAEETQATEGKKGKTVEAEADDETRFGSVTGTGVITAGVLRNKDLEVKAPGLRAEGAGAVVLPTREVNYLLKVKMVTSKQGQGGQASKDMYGVMVPIRISGTFDNPRYWVSVDEYARALGGAVIGTAGSLLGGVKDAIKGVGKAVDESCCDKDGNPKEEKPEKKGGLFGIF